MLQKELKQQENKFDEQLAEQVEELGKKFTLNHLVVFKDGGSILVSIDEKRYMVYRKKLGLPEVAEFLVKEGDNPPIMYSQINENYYSAVFKEVRPDITICLTKGEPNNMKEITYSKVITTTNFAQEVARFIRESDELVTDLPNKIDTIGVVPEDKIVSARLNEKKQLFDKYRKSTIEISQQQQHSAVTSVEIKVINNLITCKFASEEARDAFVKELTDGKEIKFGVPKFAKSAFAEGENFPTILDGTDSFSFTIPTYWAANGEPTAVFPNAELRKKFTKMLNLTSEHIVNIAEDNKRDVIYFSSLERHLKEELIINIPNPNLKLEIAVEFASKEQRDSFIAHLTRGANVQYPKTTREDSAFASNQPFPTLKDDQPNTFYLPCYIDNKGMVTAIFPNDDIGVRFNDILKLVELEKGIVYDNALNTFHFDSQQWKGEEKKICLDVNIDLPIFNFHNREFMKVITDLSKQISKNDDFYKQFEICLKKAVAGNVKINESMIENAMKEIKEIFTGVGIQTWAAKRVQGYVNSLSPYQLINEKLENASKDAYNVIVEKFGIVACGELTCHLREAYKNTLKAVNSSQQSPNVGVQL